MRVALYARYSSELQNQKSAEDQLAALRQVVAARGWREVAAFADRGISGATIANRPELQTLLFDAQRGAFDLVLAESLDRLSRDQEGTAHIYKRLNYSGVLLESLNEGRISEIHVGLSGTMNQLFLVELGKKTRRGLVARVQAGFSGGGRCYGYKVVDKGVLAVDEEQATVVRRIFRDYASGTSPRAIAHRLNAEGVPGPRGGQWTPSAIHGDRRAQDGILHQELYVGVRIFNRRRYRKHPDTGRRSSVLNPPAEWLRKPAPELRLLEDDLWATVQARKQAVSEKPAACARKPKRLLSGLLRCALCGGGMTLNGGRYLCSGNRERGTCTNGKSIKAEKVECRVLNAVRDKLLAPDAIAEAVRAVQGAADERRKLLAAQRQPQERELAEVARKLDRAQKAYLDGAMDTEDLRAVSEPLRARRRELEAALAEGCSGPAPVRLHPGAATAYRRLVQNLHLALEGADGEGARTEIRKLIERVDFCPVEGLGKFELEVHGKLAALLGLSEQARPGLDAKNPRACDSGVILGAGAGFEPATFRL